MAASSCPPPEISPRGTLATAASNPKSRDLVALFVWLISHRSALLFSRNKSTSSNQPAVLFSQNKSAPTRTNQHQHQYSSPWLRVWDPITNKQRQLPDLPLRWFQTDTLNWNAAVVCAATADRTCDHLECHHGHFLVVFVASNLELIWTCVYSSKSGAWDKHTSALRGGCRGVT
jgi:hypothetical protein